jgi:hypothetical protein
MFASAKTGRTLRVARDAVLSSFPDSTIRVDLRADAGGRGVELIPDEFGTHTVRIHRMSRKSTRGPNPKEFQKVLRVDFNGAVAVTPGASLLTTRGSLAVYHEREVHAAVGQPNESTSRRVIWKQ